MHIRFFSQYIQHFRTVGAVAPSSRYLAQRMVAPIDFSAAKVIVQFGPGTGSFTKQLLQSRAPKTSLLLIEYNEAFYQTLVEQFGHEEYVYIYNGTAEDVDGILRHFGLPSTVDYIVSGLPFVSLPERQSKIILERVRSIVRPDGAFITFQYTLLKKLFLKNYFDTMTVSREWKNVPPAYVLVCTNNKRQ